MTRAVAPRYLTGFRCLGADCEENCCSHWRIEVGPLCLARLRQLIASDPAGEGELARAIVLADELLPGGTAGAEVRRRPDGRCALLDGQGLCTLQHRHGEELLPDGCALFPRMVGRVDGRVEVTATMSCPEIARLALLADDALELIEIDQPLLPRASAPQWVAGDQSDAYSLHFSTVRAASLGLLALDHYSLPCRLYFIAQLAIALRPFYFRGTDCFHPSLLEFEIESALSPLSHALLASRLPAAPIDPGVASAVLEVMSARLTSACAPSYARLVESALAGCEADQGGRQLQLRGRCRYVDHARLWQVHQQRKQRLPPWAAARIDTHVERFCRNSLYKDCFLAWPDFFLHVQMMLIRLAMLRVLLLGHPLLWSAVECRDVEEQRRLLDRAAVEAVSATARALEHDQLFSRRVAEAVIEMKPQTPVHSAMLLDF